MANGWHRVARNIFKQVLESDERAVARILSRELDVEKDLALEIARRIIASDTKSVEKLAALLAELISGM